MARFETIITGIDIEAMDFGRGGAPVEWFNGETISVRVVQSED